ncbi:hypothetical protein BDV12DRAFT_161272 [Aspergillus spectabilis]
MTCAHALFAQCKRPNRKARGLICVRIGTFLSSLDASTRPKGCLRCPLQVSSCSTNGSCWLTWRSPRVINQVRQGGWVG